MKIAISAAAPGLDAQVEPRFGRCQHFVIVDLGSMEFESLENSGAMAAGGAGISTAQMIADKGVEVVLTGNCGPNAYRTLSAVGVQVVTGVSGRIRDAVEAYGAGKLKPNAQPSVESHYGMGMASGTAGGMGRGMGAGMTPPAASQPMRPEQEIEALKSQTRIMMEQLGQIQSRITELEKRS